MGAYTLRGLDDLAVDQLKKEAARRGMSVNRLLQALVQEGLGIDRRRARRRHDLDTLAGTWSASDAREFARATAAFEQVDEHFAGIDALATASSPAQLLP